MAIYWHIYETHLLFSLINSITYKHEQVSADPAILDIFSRNVMLCGPSPTDKRGGIARWLGVNTARSN